MGPVGGPLSRTMLYERGGATVSVPPGVSTTSEAQCDDVDDVVLNGGCDTENNGLSATMTMRASRAVALQNGRMAYRCTYAATPGSQNGVLRAYAWCVVTK